MSEDVAAQPALLKRAKSGLLWTGGAKAATFVLQTVVLVVLARLLTPTEFGIVGIALVVIGFAQIFSQLGIASAIVQHPALTPEHEATGFALSLGFGLTVGCLIYAASGAIAGFFQEPGLVRVLRSLSPMFPLYSLAVVSEGRLTRQLNFRWLATRDVLSYFVGHGVVGIILAAMGFGVWALVIATLIQSFVKCALMIWAAPPRLRPLSFRAGKELINYGGGHTLARIANYAAGQGDNLVVARLLGPAALGIYGRAYQMMALPANLIGQVLDQVLFPIMAKVQSDRIRLRNAYLRSVAVIGIVVLPFSIACFVLAPEIIRFALGERWLSVVMPFQILAIAMLFRTSYKMSDSLIRAVGAVYRRAWRQIVFAALVLTGAYLGQAGGLPGVAAGIVIAIVGNFLMMAQLSLSLLDIRWLEMLKAHVPALVLTALVGVSVYVTKWAAIAAGLPTFAIILVSLIVASAIALAACARMSESYIGNDVAWAREWIKGRLRETNQRSSKISPESSTSVTGRRP